MKNKVIIICILALGTFLRLYNINWDQNQHLHPDERFLTMVVDGETLPKSFLEYLDPKRSPLNPYNSGHGFFVYGTLPLTLNKLMVTVLNKDTYHDVTLVGRFLSALFDIGVMIVLYKLMQLLQKHIKFDKKIIPLTIFFYAIFVLPIQHAHFFVVDTFLTFFLLSSFYFAVKNYYKRSIKNAIISGIFFGCALGCKISALYMLPLLLSILVWKLTTNKTYSKALLYLLIFIGISYLTVRVVDPKLFADGNILNTTINPQFISSIKALDVNYSPGTWFPPAVQWISKKKVLFAGANIVFFGLGAPYFILTLLGSFLILSNKKNRLLQISLLWVIGFFLYQSLQFISTMRYFIFLYPFFAIAAAFGFIYVTQAFAKAKQPAIAVLLIILVSLWPYSFMQIYTRPHSRVTASEWIYKNISGGSYLAQEQWDDWLPLHIEGVNNLSFKGEQMPVIGQDTDEKWQKINEILAKADYLILTSNRAYDSMMPLPEMFPRTSQFYRDLFVDKLEFKKVKEFTSYPTLNLGFVKIPFNDQWSDEAFTVFDHPRVLIFKKI